MLVESPVCVDRNEDGHDQGLKLVILGLGAGLKCGFGEPLSYSSRGMESIAVVNMRVKTAIGTQYFTFVQDVFIMLLLPCSSSRPGLLIVT